MEPKVDKLFLTDECKKIHKCVELNLIQLSGLCNEKETVQDYFVGILRRQSILTLDLKTIFENSPVDNLTTPLIICRCLIDDFLHIFYLTQNNNQEENIIKINAEAYAENFKSLEGVVISHHRHFKGQDEYLPTGEQLRKLKMDFVSKPDNKQYFNNIKNFEFKKFITNADLANGIKDFELSKLSQRALFIWKQISNFTHYSNSTFELEISEKHREIFYLEIEEILLYTYNTIKWSFDFFSKRNGLKFNDFGLDERYRIETIGR